MSDRPAEDTACVTLRATTQIERDAPEWTAEALVHLQHWKASGRLERLQQIAWDRPAKTYDLVDLVLVLLLALTANATSLRALYRKCQPHQSLFASMWGRDRLPSRAQASVLLRTVPASVVEALLPLFVEELSRLSPNHASLGLYDHAGDCWRVFDIDPTMMASQSGERQDGDPQRAPPGSRRARSGAKGFAGRKRGSTVRSRVTLLDSHAGLWVGSVAMAGNQHRGPALDTLAATLRQMANGWQFPSDHCVLRGDGEFGKLGYIVRGTQYGPRFLTRLSNYALLWNDAAVKAVLAAGSTVCLSSPDSAVRREVFEVPRWTWRNDTLSRAVRLVITRFFLVTGRPNSIGHRDGEWVYELFVTDLPPTFTAAEVVSLYLGRGLLEATLGQEDQELGTDRWMTDHGPGQDLWQRLSQWLWNDRNTSPNPVWAA